MNIRKRRYTHGLMLAASVLCYLPGCAWAEESPVPGSQVKITTEQGPADKTGPTVVTIFGRKKITDAARRTRLKTNSASSCMFGVGAENIEGRFDADDDDDLAAFDADFNDAENERKTFKDNSPYGDASVPDTVGRSGSSVNATLPGMGTVVSEIPDCMPGDFRFAAGRNYILNHDTSLNDAYAAFDAKDYPKAMALFKSANNSVGYPEAALIVGKMYLYGVGASRSTANAVVWLNKAYVYTASRISAGKAQKFNPLDPEAMTARTDAAMTLARIYRVGWDMPKDPVRARDWYLKASDLGYVPATYLLGQASRNGYGCSKNITQAVAYFKRAGQSGYAPSQYTLGVIYYTGEEEIAQDKPLAAAWLVAAAKHGHAGALYAVGRMYDLGETVPADPKRALVYYKEAATKGNADAQNALALSFYAGDNVAKDADTARKLFQQAAKQGLPDAMFNLAVMYTHGEGGEKDLTLAYVWMKLAADSGLEKAAPAVAEILARLTPDERAKAEGILNPPHP